MFKSRWLMGLIVSIFLLLAQIPTQAGMLQAGAILSNGGDRGIAHQIDCSGDVCVSYEDDQGFSTTTTSNVVEIGVKQVYGLRIEPASTTITAKQGQTVVVNYTICNTGNGNDVVKLRVESKDWKAKVSPESIALTPGEAKSVSVTITVPNKRSCFWGISLLKAMLDKSSSVILIASSLGQDNWGDADEIRAKTTIKVISSNRLWKWMIGLLLITVVASVQ